MKKITLTALKNSIQRLINVIKKTKDDLVGVLKEMKHLCPYYDYVLELTFAIEVLNDELKLTKDNGKRIALEETITHFEALLQEFNIAVVSDVKAEIDLVTVLPQSEPKM